MLRIWCFLTVLAILLMPVSALAQTTSTAPVVDRAALQQQVAPVIEKAMKFLAAGQDQDGGWHRPPPGAELGVTALVAKAFIQDPNYGPNHPVTRRAVEFMLKSQQPDGGFYSPGSPYANYTTSVVLMALSSSRGGEGDRPRLRGPGSVVSAETGIVPRAETGTGPRAETGTVPSAGTGTVPDLQDKISAAQKWLAGNQWDEGEKDNDGRAIDAGHPWYGGAGYGREKRPDLSNTQMMLGALHESGLPPSDPVYQKALKFISRCQMLSQGNDQPFARGAEDGGFIYSPANSGESKAGRWEQDGRQMLRSYGSMTYAGFKSLLYAGLDRNDPRVKAARDWIGRYYDLDANPNMPGAQSKEGLFYFYHVFARALDAWGEPYLVDAQGRRHDWRAELAAKLRSLQAADGSWINEKDRWQEGNPFLVTAYAVLALQAAVQ